VRAPSFLQCAVQLARCIPEGAQRRGWRVSRQPDHGSCILQHDGHAECTSGDHHRCRLRIAMQLTAMWKARRTCTQAPVPAAESAQTGMDAAFAEPMDLSPGTPTVEYARVLLLIINAAIFGSAIWLYLRAPGDAPQPACPLCGSGSDILCVGVHRAGMTTESERSHLVAAGQTLGRTRLYRSAGSTQPLKLPPPGPLVAKEGQCWQISLLTEERELGRLREANTSPQL